MARPELTFAQRAPKYELRCTKEEYLGDSSIMRARFAPVSRPEMTLIIAQFSLSVEWELYANDWLATKGRFEILDTEDALELIVSSDMYQRALSNTHVAGKVVLGTTYAKKMTEVERNNVGAVAIELQAVLERYGFEPTATWKIRKT